MCEFKILIQEPGKKEYQATEDISYLSLQDNGTIILTGFGVKETIDAALITEVNVYADEGAKLRLLKIPMLKDFVQFLKMIETGSYNPEIETSWNSFVKKGNALIKELKENK